MPYDFNIYHSQVTPNIPDYDTVSLLVSSDLNDYATKSFVTNQAFLPLQGGTLFGDVFFSNVAGTAKKIILNTAEGLPVSIQSGITFTSALTSEVGIIVPRLLLTDGRLDVTPDPIFNRAEIRIKGNNTQFNIFNINTFEYYMRVNTDTSFMIGQNTVALSAGAVAMGVGTSAINVGAFSHGVNTRAEGINSLAFGELTQALGNKGCTKGNRTIAIGVNSCAEGSNTIALGNNSHTEGNNTVTGRAFTFQTFTSATRVFTFAPEVSAFFNFTGSGDGLAAIINGAIYPFKILNRSTLTGNITADRLINQPDKGPDLFNIIYLNTGNNAHAEGSLTVASGDASHAEGTGTVASGAGSHAEGTAAVASGAGSHAEGSTTQAIGSNSHAEGGRTVAFGSSSHAGGVKATAAHEYTYAWSDANLNTLFGNVSTTRPGQYMVSASGGMFIPGNVGIGTDSNQNALTVVGQISATSTIFSSGAPVVVSTSTFETPTTGISAVNNIIAMSQATYEALTIKRPNTFYIIV